MKRYNGDFRLSGDRIVEIPWVRRKMCHVHGRSIADFGGIIRTHGVRLGYYSYEIPPDNSVTVYDCDDNKDLQGQYVKADLMDINSIAPRQFDIGICVSALEHFGLMAYDNREVDNGDALGLQTMMNSIKIGGLLYLTVPAGRGIRMGRNGWIREYSPQQLKCLIEENATDYNSYTIDYFWYDRRDSYWYECSCEDLVREKSKEDDDQSVVTGLACITISKGTE